ncbi:MAG: hypothetical protein P8R42_21795 [Candidatus Binatia bacterium]|nr:hypothetical protein [Candidatus Binatia bacterium]
MNNYWNRAASEPWAGASVPARTLLQRAIDSLRIVRFLHVSEHQRALREAQQVHQAARAVLADWPTYVAPEAKKPLRALAKGTQEHHLLGHRHVLRDETRTDGDMAGDELTDVNRLDLQWMMEEARQADMPVVAIAYPIPADATARLRHRLEASGAPVPKMIYATAHPTQALYHAVGDMVFETIEQHRLLPPPR